MAPTLHDLTVEPDLSYSVIHSATYRQHSARIGRLHTPDRARGNIYAPQRLNRYSYVRNDPVNRVDPKGLDDDLASFEMFIDGGGGGGGGGSGDAGGDDGSSFPVPDDPTSGLGSGPVCDPTADPFCGDPTVDPQPDPGPPPDTPPDDPPTIITFVICSLNLSNCLDRVQEILSPYQNTPSFQKCVNDCRKNTPPYNWGRCVADCAVVTVTNWVGVNWAESWGNSWCMLKFACCLNGISC